MSLRQIILERREPLLHVAIDRTPESLAGSHQVPTVVMLHGIASSAVTFVHVVPLVQATHRVVALDLLGFGESPRPDDAEYTLDEHVGAIGRTLRSMGITRFTLVGHSLGCLISARYAATHRKAVERLVLVSPPVYLPPDNIGDPRVRARVSGYLAAYRFLRENKEFTIANAAWVSRLLPIKNVMEITEENWTPFVKSLEHCIETQTVISDLATVEAPIELVYGVLDQFLVPEAVGIIARMKGVTAHPVRASDHVLRKSMARVVAASIDATAPPSTAPAR